MKGTITEVRGGPNPNCYFIEGEDKKTYLAHLGDIKGNEDLLYALDKQGKTIKLAQGDSVEFQPESGALQHGIHVKKIN